MPDRLSSTAAAAVSLAHLLASHPELPAVTWSVSGCGLSGGMGGRHRSDEQLRVILAAYAAVLGVEPAVLRGPTHDGLRVIGTWCGTPIEVGAHLQARSA